MIKRESGKADVAAGTGSGWIERDRTSMSLGVFKDLPVDDRTEKYGELSTGKFFAAGAVTQIVLHQTQSPTGASTLGGYAGLIKKFKTTRVDKRRGAHYLIDEKGVVILVVPVTKVVSHVALQNSKSVGIEHVGMPTSLPMPKDRKDATNLTAIRSGVRAMALTPKLEARILGMSDAVLAQFAHDAVNDWRTSTSWPLFGDINAAQKRASFLLLGKLEKQLGLADTDVFAHETLVAKSPGEGENIKEYLDARTAYPRFVTKLDALVAADATLAADAGLKTIVTAEKELVAALKLDATAAENAAVLSGTDAAATKRQAARDAFYASFWIRFVQLDELVAFLGTSGSSKPMTLATKIKGWTP
jgi:hypothetical protein